MTTSTDFFEISVLKQNVNISHKIETIRNDIDPSSKLLEIVYLSHVTAANEENCRSYLLNKLVEDYYEFNHHNRIT